MSKLLIVADALTGPTALDAVRERHRDDPALEVVLTVPRPRPRLGAVVYEDVVEQAAQVRADLAWLLLAEREGLDAHTELGAADLHSAALDAIDDHDPDEVLLITGSDAVFPLRRHRTEADRLADATGLPVRRVAGDGGRPVRIALALADRPEAAGSLERWLTDRAADGRRLLVCLVPLEHGTGTAMRVAARRRDALVERMRVAGAWTMGMVGDPDPLVAAVNALDALPADELVVALSAGSRASRARLLAQLASAVRCPVTAVPVEQAAEPPAAGRVGAAA